VRELTLRVEGMTCRHCVRAVSSALRHVPGVRFMEIKGDRVTLRLDGQADVEALLSAVRQVGFAAARVDANSSSEPTHVVG
jgi:copper chaperone